MSVPPVLFEQATLVRKERGEHTMKIPHHPRSSARRRAPALLLAALAVVAVTGCSSSSSSSTPKAAATTPPASAPVGAPSAGTSATGSAAASASTGTSVTVTEKEYSITPSQTQLAPGTYTFVAENTGTVVHALEIAGPGVSATRTDSIPPGQQAKLTVTLQPGSYELWCPIDSHKALGMDTHIQVAGSSS
ncbi:cupredoxin domain-containing protein [Kitasatospora sp. NBC_01266]|uniref:cupredoxin domain-containing protein n=1 Tax=Kitasatospora sp. NBC_01266 TaxID=2903572 RepID=UPI002E2EFD56|nr:cupredoxin domain-containing protein [Kitasatospora sp. NBC_01266]